MTSAPRPPRAPDGRRRAPPVHARRVPPPPSPEAAEPTDRHRGHGPGAGRRHRRWVLGSLGSDDQKVDSDILGPMPSPFAGTWTSTDTDGSSQTMGIQHADGDEHEVVLHDDAATACSGAPATVTGTARLSSVTELVVPQPVATCDDGSTPMTPDGQRLDEVLTEITFVHDPDTGTLTDSYGVVWRRPGAAPNGPTEEGGPIIEGPSPYEGPGWPLPLTTSPRAWRSTSCPTATSTRSWRMTPPRPGARAERQPCPGPGVAKPTAPVS